MAEPSFAVMPGHLHSEHLGQPCGAGSQVLPQHLDQGLHMHTPVQWSIVEETLGLKKIPNLFGVCGAWRFKMFSGFCFSTLGKVNSAILPVSIFIKEVGVID